MRAAAVHAPGGPEALQIEQVPVPVATPGEVLIRVEACGINRSELFTRRGQSPGIVFPRILGIEAVGTVAAAPGGEHPIPAGPVFRLERIAEAHRLMEANQAGGKIVVVTR